MAIPSLIVTPHESRSRYGTVTPELAGAVEQTDRGWRLFRGVPDATLLLAPEGSYQRGESIAPTLTGGAAVVPGTFGDRWRMTTYGAAVRVPFDQQVTQEAGTAILRMVYLPEATGSYPLSIGYTQGLLLGVYSTGYINSYLGSVSNFGSTGHRPVRGDLVTIALTWDEDRAFLFYEGELVREIIRPSTSINFGSTVELFMDTALRPTEVEGAILADTRWSDDKIIDTMTMPHRWTGDDTGAITVPHPQPVGDLLVRYRENGTVKSARLNGPGRFGQHGMISIGGGYIEITTDREIELLGLIAYPAEAVVTGSGLRESRGGNITFSGDVIERDGLLELWTGTTNLIPNGDFESDVTGWSSQSGARVQDTADSVIGGASLRYVNGTGTSSGGVFTSLQGIPVKPLTTYTVSYWIKGNREGDARAYNRFWDAEGDGAAGEYQATSQIGRITTEWRRVVYQFTTTETAASTYQVIYAQQDDPQPGDTIWLDAVQLEEGPFPTPFTVGTRPDGTITIPLTAAPRRIIIRTRDDNGDVWLHELDATDDYFGDHGWLAHEGEQLRIGTDHTTTILSVVIDPELSDEEALKVLQSDVWRWNTVLPLPAGIVSGEVDVGINVIPRDVDVPIAVIPGEVRHG